MAHGRKFNQDEAIRQSFECQTKEYIDNFDVDMDLFKETVPAKTPEEKKALIERDREFFTRPDNEAFTPAPSKKEEEEEWRV